ncbi:MAG: hypothetical protein N4A70_19380 [Pelagimonas sp.]|jgi:predicted metal-dependent enzyme (double-stranded beta helix superfamily)|nr:hypothetical protein [Pelagimonas sp.]
MQVILHTGVHCTDNDMILKCLLRNTDEWRREGIAIPGPSKYRTLLSDAINRLVNSTPGSDTREILFDAILEEDPNSVKRLLLSNENFFSVPKLMFSGGLIYRKAEARLSTLARIFDQDDIELFIGLRDPASFLPAAYHTTPHTDFLDFMSGVDMMQFRWSDLIRRIRTDVPSIKITCWSNEDSPFIWGEILRTMAGIDMSRKITGAFELFSTIVSKEGMQRFRGFLKENPTINEDQKRRVMMAILDKYALEDAIEEELDLPGWNEPLIDHLTATYEADLDIIATIPGVRMIAP